jgi:hypothetical protein
MHVTEQQKMTLYDDGAVLLPGIVPQESVGRALRAINSSLGTQGLSPADLPRFRARSYCPELQGTPEILHLLTATPLWSVAEALIGTGKIKPVSSGQIALRFPTMEEPSAPQPHLDGMYTPTNGVPAGTIANFTALIGIFLSDVPGDLAGNLSVWPGTHHLYARYFQHHGPQSLLEGMPRIDLPAERQITARAGDAVLCHYQLAHGVAGNGSPHTRYAIFFRLSHVDHDALHWDCMTDIWREWEGMADVVRERAAASVSG